MSRPVWVVVLATASLVWAVLLIASPTGVSAHALEARPVEFVYATSTRYELTAPPRDREESAAPGPGECKVRNVAYVGRHGMRNPSKSGMKKLYQLEAKLRGVQWSPSGPPAHLRWLSGWKCPIEYEEHSQLVPAGAVAAEAIGRRLRDRFPSLMSPSNAENFHVLSSRKARCVDTARALLEGVLGEEGARRVEVRTADSPELEPLVRTNHVCKRQKKYEKSEECKNHMNRYKTEHYPTIVAGLEQRLGSTLGEGFFDVTTVDLIWGACKMEVSSFGQYDQFCSLFTEGEKAIMLRAEDIKYYYKLGGGNPLVQALSCPLLGAVEESWGPPGVVGVFTTHDGTIIPFISALGLFADLYDPTAPNQWAISRVAPMTTNVVFEVQECGGDTRYVRVWHNEVPVVLPRCGGGEWCPMGTYRAYYGVNRAACTHEYATKCALENAGAH